MKLRLINFGNARAFSLVEMMVTIAIVGILISLLIPALGLVKKTASMVKQKSQFSTIETGLESFKMDFNEYPESMENSKKVPSLSLYSGANKLAEAMVGRDGLGFHPDSLSVWASDPTFLYDATTAGDRQECYLEIDTAKATLLEDIYSDTGGYTEDKILVLADTFGKVKHRSTGKRTGMPVLYYRANTSNVGHSYAEYMSIGCTYSYFDNWPLMQLGVPFDASLQHPILSVGANPEDNFYDMTKNEDFTVTPRPYRPESFILHSAGLDGLYGTEDDVFNFDKGK